MEAGLIKYFRRKRTKLIENGIVLAPESIEELLGGWNAVAVTPETIRHSIAHFAPLAQSDPEAFHSEKDTLYREVLLLIAGRKLHDPEGCAAAALEMELVLLSGHYNWSAKPGERA